VIGGRELVNSKALGLRNRRLKGVVRTGDNVGTRFFSPRDETIWVRERPEAERANLGQWRKLEHGRCGPE